MKLLTRNRLLPSIPQIDRPFAGLLAGVRAGGAQARGLLEVVSLYRPLQQPDSQRTGLLSHLENFASPVEFLKLVEVPSYGTMVLRNASAEKPMIVPMHVGFFQDGAQNHATCRALMLAPGETLRVEDCFCIQAAQGGLLKRAEQRFLMLPAGLRAAALGKQNVEEFGRLWDNIDDYTRRFGVARGGHLERFLRPYFSRLLPFRHAFEPTQQQIGAAYFVAGELLGIEVGPNAGCFRDLFPILSIYCYGPSAVLAERDGKQPARDELDLQGLMSLDDLRSRLAAAREKQLTARVERIREVSGAAFKAIAREDRHKLKLLTLAGNGWMGQVIRHGEELAYLSVFRA